MKRIAFIGAIGLLASFLNLTSANADSLCNNGSFSSNSGRGTCSWNGGVNKSWPSYSDPGSSSYNRNNGFGSSKRNNDFGGSIGDNGFGSSKRNNGFGSSKKCPKYSFC